MEQKDQSLHQLIARAMAACAWPLDIYSGRRLPHFMVVPLAVAGTALLVSGVTIGLLPILLVLLANADGLLTRCAAALQRRQWMVVALPLAVLGVIAVAHPPTALDDLLRHIAVGLRPGGYASMYAYSTLPPVEMYPLFDFAVGALARHFGEVAAMWVVQASAFCAFAAAFLASGRRLLADNPDRAYWLVLALSIAISLSIGRLLLARPEIFMTAWLLVAPALRSRRAVAAWSVSGVVLGFGYWLAPVYFPAVLLLPLALLHQALLFGAMCAAWLAVWMWMSDGRLPEAYGWLAESLANRVAGLSVGENAPIFHAAMHPLVVLLIFGALWAWRTRMADPRFLVLVAYFAAANQLRYLSTVVPLLAFYILSGLGDRRVVGPGGRDEGFYRVLLTALAVAALASSWPKGFKQGDLPTFRLPDGAVVLTGFTPATYSLVFRNSGDVRVAPAFEVGAAERGVQTLVLELSKGRLDCEALRPYRFTHLVENTLAGPTRDCLRLSATDGEWRLWELALPR